MAPTTAAEPESASTKKAPGPRVLVGIIAAMTVALGLMLLAFASPAIHSGPHDLPLAVSGPEEARTHLEAALDAQSPAAST